MIAPEPTLADVVVADERVQPDEGERLVVVEAEFRPDVRLWLKDVGVQIRTLLEPVEDEVFPPEMPRERRRRQDGPDERSREDVIQRRLGVEDEHRRRARHDPGERRVRTDPEDQIGVEPTGRAEDPPEVSGELGSQPRLARVDPAVQLERLVVPLQERGRTLVLAGQYQHLVTVRLQRGHDVAEQVDVRRRVREKEDPHPRTSRYHSMASPACTLSGSCE